MKRGAAKRRAGKAQHCVLRINEPIKTVARSTLVCSAAKKLNLL
jgi:hypothetical protein